MARKKSTKAPVPIRAPNEREAASIALAKDRVQARPRRPEPTITERKPGAVTIGAPHADDLGLSYQILDTLGSASNAFLGKALRDLVNTVGERGKPTNTEDLGAGLALIAAVEPRDELEAALAVQMAAAHTMALSAAALVRRSTTVEGLNTYGNLANKTMRTFAAQMDALAKHRRGGEQVVRHVHVYEGGQAVVAEQVIVGGWGGEKVGVQPHVIGAQMLGENPEGSGMPATGHAERAMSPARGQVARGPEGQ